MKHPEFDARYQQLLLDLDQLATLLRKHGEDKWAGQLDKDRLGLQAFESKAIERVLSAFGGMGSFNDVFLHPTNGHSIREEEVAEVDQHLSDISSQIWANAKYLKQQLGSR